MSSTISSLKEKQFLKSAQKNLWRYVKSVVLSSKSISPTVLNEKGKNRTWETAASRDCICQTTLADKSPTGSCYHQLANRKHLRSAEWDLLLFLRQLVQCSQKIVAMLQLLLRRAKTGNPRAVIYLRRRLRLKWLPCSLCVPCCQDGRKVEPINRTCQGRPVSTQDLVLFRGVGSESSYINQVVRSKPLFHIY